MLIKIIAFITIGLNSLLLYCESKTLFLQTHFDDINYVILVVAAVFGPIASIILSFCVLKSSSPAPSEIKKQLNN